MLDRIDRYTDYREYLKDYYADQKRRKKVFSFRFFNQRAGLSSPSHFREVMTGKRNLTPKTIEAFAKGLGLGEVDARFFTALVYFNQSTDAKEKQYHLEQMTKLRRRVRQQSVPVDRYAYYSRWYHLAVRELACLKAWGEDHAGLAKALRPPIKKSEAREALRLLLELGFLERGSEGGYHQKEPAIRSGKDIDVVAIRKLNRELAAFAGDAIEGFPPEERDISSLVIGVSQANLPLLRDEIKEFKQRILRLVEDDKSADRVYNLNVQLFPMSERVPHA